MSDLDEEVIPNTQDENGDEEGFELDSYEAGIIKKVELINFMCHSHLTFDFNPSVNFLIGSNGSGKSAVLVGLVTCLGAAARFSNRSSKVGDLVREGCNQAIIRITLRNEGPEAYKPDVYGALITVERKINREGGGSYSIKDENNKKKSGTREELDAILEQFNIQVDNPCNVLMQDASKLFLNSNKPEKKYELFLKATQLEQMKEDLEQTGNNLKMSESTLAAKQEALGDMEDKLKALETKVQALHALETHRTKVKEMRATLAWAHVQTKEADLETIEAEIAVADDRLSKLQEAKRQKEASIEAMQVDQRKKSAALDAFRIEGQRFQQEFHQLELEVRRIKSEATKFDAAMDARKEEQHRIQKRIDNLKQQIRTKQAEARGDGKEAEYRRNLATAQKKHAQVEKLTADLKASELRKPTLESDISADEDRISTAEGQLGSLMTNLKRSETELQRLSQVGKDRAAAFGVSAAQVRRLIQENKREFRKTPIGPIGMHVKLLDETWAIAVDLIAGKSFDKFLVDSLDDLRILKRLMQQDKISDPPQVIVMPFSEPKYQLPSNRLPAARYTTILSVLQIDDPVCFNALIDDANIEGIALFKTAAEAKQEMFSRGRNGPDNVKEAFANEQFLQLSMVNGTQIMKGLKPRKSTRLQPDVQGAVEGYKATVRELSAKVQPLKQDLQQFRARLASNTKELQRVNNALRVIPGEVEKLSAEIEVLEKAPEVPPGMQEEINALEATLPDLDEKIKAAQVEVEKTQEEKNEFLQQLKPVQERQKEVKAAQLVADNNLNEAVAEVDQLSSAIQDVHKRIPRFVEALAKLTTSLNDATARHEAQMKLVEEYCVKAQVLSKRPSQPVEESTESLTTKITTMEKMIAQQQIEQDLDTNIVEQYEDAKQSVSELREAIDDTRATIERATDMLQKRVARWVDFRRRIQQRTKALFISYLSQRNFLGDLEFDHKNKTLEIRINPNRADAAGDVRDTATLSGGERSYSTVSLLLALWEMMESPFRAMDEFDVFMDAVNRLIAMQMLLHAASQKKHRQHIFLTPQQLQGVQPQDWIKIFRMKPPIRNQRTITGMMNGNEEDEE